ncbi:hypothetical protein MNEG_3723 [Monoraphidium neglectum]|uniref:Uncharacterized protein n=1 Tax=Monoraphidium neglectum TaxID=145388 RepID=A0A0D2K0U2_9CHLO|nr:hypothetical protein MNEG_3723 [Monoraphidium neglectum]KIZ04233.1 hypothetical protein MNEG_3723 [Monoraphidium neglectum]|eukprot:XP_013903252.1 hypothetical protein MNEG_3723 [Monoraphidium neglectum]
MATAGPSTHSATVSTNSGTVDMSIHNDSHGGAARGGGGRRAGGRAGRHLGAAPRGGDDEDGEEGGAQTSRDGEARGEPIGSQLLMGEASGGGGGDGGEGAADGMDADANGDGEDGGGLSGAAGMGGGGGGGGRGLQPGDPRRRRAPAVMASLSGTHDPALEAMQHAGAAQEGAGWLGSPPPDGGPAMPASSAAQPGPPARGLGGRRGSGSVTPGAGGGAAAGAADAEAAVGASGQLGEVPDAQPPGWRPRPLR